MGYTADDEDDVGSSGARLEGGSYAAFRMLWVRFLGCDVRWAGGCLVGSLHRSRQSRGTGPLVLMGDLWFFGLVSRVTVGGGLLVVSIDNQSRLSLDFPYLSRQE